MAQYEVVSDENGINQERVVGNVQHVEPIEHDQVVEQGQDLKATDLSYESIMKESMENYVNKAFEKFKLERTEVNSKKILSNLNKKVMEWMETEDILLEDVDDIEQTKRILESSLERRKLENNASNMKKIIELLLENK